MLKKIIYAILRDWKFFIFIVVLVYGFYLVDFNINKNINRLIRALPLSLSFDEVQSAIDSSLNDVKGELQSITMELSNISSHIEALELTR